jgi:arginase family enzyme
MEICGENPKVQLLDISEYNPTIEDYRTGRLCVSLFYYYLLGLNKRFQKDPKLKEFIVAKESKQA